MNALLQVDDVSVAFPEDVADLLKAIERVVGEVEGVDAPVRELKEPQASVGEGQVDLAVGDERGAVGPGDDVGIADARSAPVACANAVQCDRAGIGARDGGIG